MNGDLILSGFLHWLHLVSAVLAVGSVFFLRMILLPGISKSGTDTSALMPLIHMRFKMLIHSSILILLVTGFYRYISQMRATGGWSLYHALMGIKILLAFALFSIAIALLMPGAQPNMFQKNRGKWLLVNLVLGITILVLSAYLRRMWDFRQI